MASNDISNDIILKYTAVNIGSDNFGQQDEYQLELAGDGELECRRVSDQQLTDNHWGSLDESDSNGEFILELDNVSTNRITGDSTTITYVSPLAIQYIQKIANYKDTFAKAQVNDEFSMWDTVIAVPKNATGDLFKITVQGEINNDQGETEHITKEHIYTVEELNSLGYVEIRLTSNTWGYLLPTSEEFLVDIVGISFNNNGEQRQLSPILEVYQDFYIKTIE